MLLVQFFVKALLLVVLGKLKVEKKPVACDYQLPPFCFPDLVRRNRPIFPPWCVQ